MYAISICTSLFKAAPHGIVKMFNLFLFSPFHPLLSASTHTFSLFTSMKVLENFKKRLKENLLYVLEERFRIYVFNFIILSCII